MRVALRQLPIGAQPRLRQLPLGDDFSDISADDLQHLNDIPMGGPDQGSFIGGPMPADIYDAPPSGTFLDLNDINVPSGGFESTSDFFNNQPLYYPSGPAAPAAVATPNAVSSVIQTGANVVRQLTSSATPGRPTPTTNAGAGAAGSQSTAKPLEWFAKSSVVQGLPNWGVVIGGLVLTAGIIGVAAKSR